MDALKILLPFFLLEAAHIWAKRWTWVPTWAAVASVIAGGEMMAIYNPSSWVGISIAGAWALLIWALLIWVGKESNKRTLSRDIWALFKKDSPEYDPLKGFACVGTWLIFSIYLALHFLFKI